MPNNPFGNPFNIPQVQVTSLKTSLPDPNKSLAALMQMQIQQQRMALAAARAAARGSRGANLGKAMEVMVPQKDGTKKPVLVYGHTEKERKAAADKAIADATQAILLGDTALQKDLADFEGLSVPGKKEVVDRVRRTHAPRLAQVLGISGEELSKQLTTGLDARIRQREEEIDNAGLGTQLFHAGKQIFRNVADAIGAIGETPEQKLARGKASAEAAAQDARENAFIDEINRLNAENRSSAGFQLSNPLKSATMHATPLAAMMAPALVGGAIGTAVAPGPGTLGGLISGASIGAGLGGAVGAGLPAAGEAMQRVATDPNLNEAQKEDVIGQTALGSGAIAGAIGAVPFGAGSLMRGALTKRAVAKAFPDGGAAAVARHMAPGASLAEQGAAREALIQAQTKAWTPNWWQQIGIHGANAATVGGAFQVGSNLAYGLGTGQDVPLTEGLGEAMLSGAVLGVPFGIGGRIRSAWHKQRAGLDPRAMPDWTAMRGALGGAPGEILPLPDAASMDAAMRQRRAAHEFELDARQKAEASARANPVATPDVIAGGYAASDGLVTREVIGARPKPAISWPRGGPSMQRWPTSNTPAVQEAAPDMVAGRVIESPRRPPRQQFDYPPIESPGGAPAALPPATLQDAKDFIARRPSAAKLENYLRSSNLSAQDLQELRNGYYKPEKSEKKQPVVVKTIDKVLRDVNGKSEATGGGSEQVAGMEPVRPAGAPGVDTENLAPDSTVPPDTATVAPAVANAAAPETPPGGPAPERRGYDGPPAPNTGPVETPPANPPVKGAGGPENALGESNSQSAAVTNATRSEGAGGAQLEDQQRARVPGNAEQTDARNRLGALYNSPAFGPGRSKGDFSSIYGPNSPFGARQEAEAQARGAQITGAKEEAPLPNATPEQVKAVERENKAETPVEYRIAPTDDGNAVLWKLTQQFIDAGSPNAADAAQIIYLRARTLGAAVGRSAAEELHDVVFSFNAPLDKQVKDAWGEAARSFDQDAWHSTPNDVVIDQLSTDYMSSGEGAQLHGFGIYVMLGKDRYDDSADRYRSRLADKRVRIILDGEWEIPPENFREALKELNVADDVIDDVVGKWNGSRDLNGQYYTIKDLKGKWASDYKSGADVLNRWAAVRDGYDAYAAALRKYKTRRNFPHELAHLQHVAYGPDFSDTRINRIALGEQLRETTSQIQRLLKIADDGATLDEKEFAAAKQQLEKIYHSIAKKIDQYVELSKRLDADIHTPGQTLRVQVPDNEKLLYKKGYNEELGYHEDGYYSDQSAYIKNALKEMAEDAPQQFQKMRPYVERLLRRVLQNKIGINNFYKGLSWAFRKEYGDNIWADKEASTLLYRYGIEGIRYIGSIDGECAVLFNGRDTQILERFYDQNGGRGRINFYNDGLARVLFGNTADASTAIHEGTHLYLERISRYLREEEVKPEYRRQIEADMTRLGEWAGEKDGGWDVLDWSTETIEKVARASEAYFRTGKAPTPELEGLFARIKEVLMQLYQSFKELIGAKSLPKDIREIFDRQLTGYKAENPRLTELRSAKNKREFIYDELYTTHDDVLDAINNYTRLPDSPFYTRDSEINKIARSVRDEEMRNGRYNPDKWDGWLQNEMYSMFEADGLLAGTQHILHGGERARKQISNWITDHANDSFAPQTLFNKLRDILNDSNRAIPAIYEKDLTAWERSAKVKGKNIWGAEKLTPEFMRELRGVFIKTTLGAPLAKKEQTLYNRAIKGGVAPLVKEPLKLPDTLKGADKSTVKTVESHIRDESRSLLSDTPMTDTEIDALLKSGNWKELKDTLLGMGIKLPRGAQKLLGELASPKKPPVSKNALTSQTYGQFAEQTEEFIRGRLSDTIELDGNWRDIKEELAEQELLDPTLGNALDQLEKYRASQGATEWNISAVENAVNKVRANRTEDNIALANAQIDRALQSEEPAIVHAAEKARAELEQLMADKPDTPQVANGVYQQEVDKLADSLSWRWDGLKLGLPKTDANIQKVVNAFIKAAVGDNLSSAEQKLYDKALREGLPTLTVNRVALDAMRQQGKNQGFEISKTDAYKSNSTEANKTTDNPSAEIC